MADQIIQIVGLEEVQQFIRDAPKTVVALGFAKALSAAANVFADAAEAKCPVKKEDTGGLLEKGVLRDSIMVSITLDSQFRGGFAEIGWGSTASDGTKIPPNLPLWVEVGHRTVVPGSGTYTDNRGRRRKGTHVSDVPAHPFFRDAFDVSVDRAIEAFASSLSSSINSGGGNLGADLASLTQAAIDERDNS